MWVDDVLHPLDDETPGLFEDSDNEDDYLGKQSGYIRVRSTISLRHLE